MLHVGGVKDEEAVGSSAAAVVGLYETAAKAAASTTKTVEITPTRFVSKRSLGRFKQGRCSLTCRIDIMVGTMLSFRHAK